MVNWRERGEKWRKRERDKWRKGENAVIRIKGEREKERARERGKGMEKEIALCLMASQQTKPSGLPTQNNTRLVY